MQSDFPSPDFTHEFGCEIEVGGEHVLWDALDEFGKLAVEMAVAFFGRHRKKVFDADLCRAERFL